MNELINNKIVEIEAQLSKFNNASIGLFSGSIGLSFFYEALYKLTGQKQYLEKCKDLVDGVMNRLSEDELSHSFANGYTGIAWAINLLAKKNLLEYNSRVLFKELDDYIYEASLTELSNGRYDYMHHGMGGAIYALSRLPHPKALGFLKKFIKIIDEIKIEDDDGIRWKDKFNIGQKDVVDKFNLGLAHGMPGILSVLMQIYEYGLFNGKIKKLVDGCLKWILKCKITTPSHSIYPSSVYEDYSHNDGASRLAWCYGDLGLAWTFLKTGKLFKNETWIAESVSIINKSLNRVDPLANPNIDAGLCHGTAGIAYFFKKFYRETNIEEYRASYEFWIKETLAQAKFDDGLAGYKTYIGVQSEIKWTNDYGFLEGTCGTGLVLIDNLCDFNEWDKALLL